ncbi:hypothetical protein [Metamycoplasma hominis]|uniref:Uncharacterized protein n=1 Tax=Metamycoplasma hominis (strain ATCC 23114 / DSM 25592 / NBRC 14850 / NCTC 10111 / PG21) TaxID=347256 RepID=D1J7U4_METH1|nr:hypothetical protein [Metamycoplasma hominis]CAX37291.1 Hypothetical protein MHO_1570 [Metamycoplasma hominis ATCC 23114]
MEYLQNIDLSKIRSLCLQKKREFIFNYCLFEQLKDKQLKQKKSQTIDYEEDDDISKLEKFIKLLNSDNQKIFFNNFIYNNPESEWYLVYWSKNAYYKKLNYIVNLFIDFINQ